MWEYEVRPNRNRTRDWSSLEQGLTKIVSAFRSRKRLLRNNQRRFQGVHILRPFFVQLQWRPE